jgi:hypothetical protein
MRHQLHRRVPYIFYAAIVFGGFLFLPQAHASIQIVSSSIATNTTWSATTTYEITRNINVNPGIALTIPAGTVVKFNGSTTLLDIDGTLQVNGTSSNPVYFTSSNDNSVGSTTATSTGNPMPGDWAFIEVFGNSNASATINNAIIAYGGNASHATAEVEAFAPMNNFVISNSAITSSSLAGINMAGTNMTLTSSTISNNGTYGFLMSAGSFTVTSNTFSYNQMGVASLTYSGVSAINLIPSGNTATGTINLGFMVSGSMGISTTWYQDLPYIVPSSLTVDNGPTLSVNAGTVVKFSTSTAYLNEEGNFNVQGTSTNPVYFTSINDNSIDPGTNGNPLSTPNPGDWGYIMIFGNTTNSVATINDAIIRYGGGATGGYHTNLIATEDGNMTISNSQITSSTSYGVDVVSGSSTIENTTISNNGSYGIYAYQPTGSLVISSDTFTYDRDGVTFIDYYHPFVFTPSNITATGTVNIGYALSGQLPTSTWYAGSLPYIISGLTTIGFLTVNPGAVIKFHDSLSYLNVEQAASFNGISTDPIYFTSMNDNSVDPGTNGNSTSTASPGDWGDIDFFNGTATRTVNYAIIAYGGGGSSSSTGEVAITSPTIISNSQIASSFSSGIYAEGTSTITFSKINNNGIDGIYRFSGNVSSTDDVFANNALYGFYNRTSPTSSAYAIDDFWNSTSGPYNTSSNPGGTGDRVSSYVNYAPWLTYSPLNGTTTLYNLAQYKSDGVTPIGNGSSTTETEVVFSANLQSLSTASESLQIEVTTGTFMNTSTISSGWYAPSTTVSMAWTPSGGPESGSDGNYQWQARVVDSLGNASPWQSGSSSAFTIDTLPLYTQVTSTYPSTSNTTGTYWWYDLPYDNSTHTIAAEGCLISTVVEILRSYGITTTTLYSYQSSTDVNPGNLNDWLENETVTSSPGYSDGPDGALNLYTLPYYSETPSGTFRVWYDGATDHIGVASNTWVNNWLNYSSTGTIPVILTETVPILGGGGATTTHFIPATGIVIDPLNLSTDTYTVRDPYFYNTSYLEQASGTNAYDYSNSYSGATILEPTSTAVLPLYLEYAIDSAHKLFITDPDGRRLGIDPTTGISYDEIPNGGEDDSQPQAHFLSIVTPMSGEYTIKVGGSGNYQLYSYIADGKHLPAPQIITSSTTSASNVVTYHQNYSPTDLPNSAIQ